MKCYLKTENYCLKTQTKHPIKLHKNTSYKSYIQSCSKLSIKKDEK